MSPITGFTERFKGKIRAHVIYLGKGGIVPYGAALGSPGPNVFSNAGAPVNGGSGTYAGFANPGDLLVDNTNKTLYQNTNTLLSPTWTIFEAVGSAPAATQAQPANPTAPANTTTFFMQGLAGAITPTRSGKVLLQISGNFISSSVTAGDGILTQLSYGTGAAPANGAALAGTQLGNILKYTNPATVVAADVDVPFSQQAVITGLALNTAIWLDIAAKSVANVSNVGLANLSVTATEL